MKYKLLPRTGDVSAETALIQSAYALDAAAAVAENLNDVEGLLNVANMWIKLSADFNAFVNSTVFPYEEHTQTKIKTGFQGTDIIIEGEEDAGIE